MENALRVAETLVEGIYFGESPRWHNGRLWFSDFYAHAVKSVSLSGDVREEVVVPNQPSGLGWLPDGRLLVVSMLDRRLLRLDGDGLVEHADLNGLAKWHANDLVVDSQGRAYVGNFGFDRVEWAANNPPDAPTPTATLARVDPDGTVHAAADGLHFPNGSVITPDGRTMVIAETLASRLTAFDIAADGSLSNRRVWAETPAAPDGICLDAEGAIWAAQPRNQEVVRVAEGGQVLDRVKTSQLAVACALGGEDRQTLMITTVTATGQEAAKEAMGMIQICGVDVPGAGWP